MLEQAIISGIAHDTGEAKVTILGVPDRPGDRGARLPAARRRGRQHRHDRPERLRRRAHGHLVHAADRATSPRAEPILAASSPTPSRPRGFSVDPEIAKISLVGAGMKSHPGVAADMFDALADAGINIEIISTSSIRISCVVRAADVERAVQRGPRPLPALGRGGLRGDRGSARAVRTSLGIWALRADGHALRARAATSRSGPARPRRSGCGGRWTGSASSSTTTSSTTRRSSPRRTSTRCARRSTGTASTASRPGSISTRCSAAAASARRTPRSGPRRSGARSPPRDFAGELGRQLHHLARDRGLQLPVPDAVRRELGVVPRGHRAGRASAAASTASCSSSSTRTPSRR